MRKYMEFIKWQSNYNTNVSSIDFQHQYLVSLINELATAKEEKKDKDIYSRVFSELVNYTKVHFKDEETIMLNAGYDNYFQHVQQHKVLIKQLVQIFTAYKNGNIDVTDRLLDILKNWLMKHILRHDLELAIFLKTR